MARIAFIGLGNMGGGMATNQVKAGHEVIAFDLSENAMRKAKENGCLAAGSAKDAVKDTDAVITMLPAGTQVESVYCEDVFGVARKDTVLVDCSTIDVETSKLVNELAKENGYQMVDAPVSGGVAAADAGTLTFMVGGSKEGFGKCEPYLQNMGAAVIHAGEAGAGQAAKICNNMLLAITMIGTCEAFAMAEKLGLDAQKFFDISSKASGQSWSMTSYCPVPGPVPAAPSNRDYAPGFAATMMLKDLKLAKEAALGTNASIPLGSVAESLYQIFVSNGNFNTDFSGIINLIKGREN